MIEGNRQSQALGPVSRRTFAAAGGAALAAIGLQGSPARGQSARAESPLKPGDVLLFQGDSITDAGRKRDAAPTPNSQPALGDGYAWLAASQLLVDRPDDAIKIFNRGISGNKVPDLAARWQVGVTPTFLIIEDGRLVSSTTGWSSRWGLKLRLWWAGW